MSTNDRIYYRKLIDLKYDHDRQELILQPEFQRAFTWDTTKMSRLIESIIMSYPLNPLHFSEETTDNGDTINEVIDGQQRLTTIFRFLDNKFKLGRLKLLPGLNGKYYKGLDVKVQKAIQNYSIGIFPYSGEDRKLKFEIFERVNTGATALTAQELRNAIYHGTYNTLLRELAASPFTKELLKMDSKRMKDVELILGFFAIRSLDLFSVKYVNMKEVLNAELRENRFIQPYELASKREEWKEFTDLCIMLLENPFRRLSGRAIETRYFNESSFYATAWAFSEFKASDLFEHRVVLRSRLAYLIDESEAFDEAMSQSVYSGQRTILLAKLFHETISKTLAE